MDKDYPLSSPMVIQSFDIKKDPFQPRGDNEEVLGPEAPQRSVRGALIKIYVNLWARYLATPTQKHYNDVKHIFCYLRGTTDMGLLYSKQSRPQLIGLQILGFYLIYIKVALKQDICSHIVILLCLGALQNKLLLPLLQFIPRYQHFMKQVENVYD